MTTLVQEAGGAGQARAGRLPAWSLFAAVLAGAGLPIYIYAPKFYADSFGLSLAALGSVLFLLRLIDVVQDPLLGALVERFPQRRGRLVAAGAALMALSMIGLFAVAPPVAPLVWFGLTITGLFSGYSLLTIAFYAEGVAKAGAGAGAGALGHVRLAAWRESGALFGVCVAAVAPTALAALSEAPFAVYAWGFAALVLLAGLVMAPEWTGGGRAEAAGLGAILADGRARMLLLLALVNALPLAVSSTLFLFFVESRLGAPGWEGILLVLFFLSAAATSPGWAALARRFGPRPVLLTAMILAILAFGWALLLGEGDVAAFAVICVVSGATIGADLTLLPALFARRMAAISPRGGAGFGLWSFVNKVTLALAAAVLLPLLDRAGFAAGAAELPGSALTMLSLLYAALPCALKLLAIALLSLIPLED